MCPRLDFVALICERDICGNTIPVSTSGKKNREPRSAKKRRQSQQRRGSGGQREEERTSSLTGCGKSLNRDDSPPQGLKPSLVLHDLRGAKAPLYHSAAGFRDFFRSLLRRAETNT